MSHTCHGAVSYVGLGQGQVNSHTCMHAAASALQLRARICSCERARLQLQKKKSTEKGKGLPRQLQLQAAKSAATGGMAGGGRRPTGTGGLCKQQGPRVGRLGGHGGRLV